MLYSKPTGLFALKSQAKTFGTKIVAQFEPIPYVSEGYKNRRGYSQNLLLYLPKL